MIRPSEDVSVVVVSHNYGRFLAEALDSILAQTRPPATIVVADDGSTDETAAVAARFAPRVAYLPLAHAGVCAARNRALPMTTGRHVCFLDADDTLAPEYVEKAASLLDASADPRLAFVYAQRRFFGASGGISGFPPFDVTRLKLRNYIMSNAMIRRDVLMRVGYDPAFSDGLEDYDLYLTLAEQGYRGLLLDEPLVNVRVHDASMTARLNTRYRQIALTRRILAKHRAFYSPPERREALHAARLRLLENVVRNRAPGRPWTSRARDLAYLLRTPAGLAQFWTQTRYLFAPTLKGRLFTRDA